jgi:hypothetical protein
LTGAFLPRPSAVPPKASERVKVFPPVDGREKSLTVLPVLAGIEPLFSLGFARV